MKAPVVEQVLMYRRVNYLGCPGRPLETFEISDGGKSEQWAGHALNEKYARLFASAPELLDALKSLMAYPQSLERKAAAELQAVAAIAKAEGRA